MKSRCISKRRACWGLTMLGAAALLLAAGPSHGAGRYSKGSEVQIKAAKKRATKVVKKKAAGPRAQQPQLMAEQFRASAQAKVAKLTDAAISTLKRLIQVTDNDDPEKPDFYFRLAEHYREKKVLFMFRARELDEKIYGTNSASRKSMLKRRQKAYERGEKQWMVNAIKMYLHIATKPAYNKFARMDEVLFNVADMLNQAKRRDKARIFFRKLIRNYPQSKYIPDAYLSFAEFYFTDGQIDNALKLYQQVGKYPNSPIYGYAIYKQGWCWLNLKNPRRALEMFVKVIKNSGKWGGTKKSKIILVKEAKKDSVRAYAHVGTPERAWSFFERIGGKYAMKMLQRLANLYYDQGKFLPSIQTFRKLIALNPKSKSLCTWQYNIMKATLSGKDKRQQVVESKRMAAVYTAMKSRGGIRKSALTECRSNASGVLRELATTWHREAQKTQNNDTYALAMYLYKEYLDNFPKEKDAYTMSFYYAELLYKLERWAAAAEAYTVCVKMKPRGKHLKESAYAAVVAWKNALNVADERTDTSTRRGKKGKKVKVNITKKIPIPENQQKMIAAFDTYIKYVPNAKELVPIMYRKARIYYTHNDYSPAISMFERIVTKHSSHDLAEYAANLLLDSLNILKRYTELNKWVDRFLKDPNLTQKGELKATLEKLKVASMRKHAQELRKGKQFKECGRLFAKLANDYQDDPRWAEMLYNAAICFEAAKLIGQAIAIRNTLIKIKPKDPLAQKAMHMIGQNYHALSWYSRAAEYYERFATKFPGEKEAPEALQNAIVFRMGQGDYDKAIEDARFFARKFGGRGKYKSKAAAVIFSLASIHEARGNKDTLVKHLNSWLRKWGRSGGQDRQIEANVKIGMVLWKQSCDKGKGVNGACIKMKRVRSKRKIKKRKKRRRKKRKTIELKTQCGPETKMKVIVLNRNKARARRAQKHFAKALALFKRAGGGKSIKGATKEDREKRANQMKYYAAAARFFQAEAAFEKFLDVKFPKGLDFSKGKSKKQKKKAEKSAKMFGKYLEEKGKKLGNTRKVYLDVIMMRQAHWAIAASARVGQLYQNFADALFTAPVPKPPIPKQLTKTEDKEDFVMMFTDTYCDTLEDKANPLEKKAVEGLATCLSKSTELSWYNEWSKLCEKELNQIKPAEYPIASEIRARPGYSSYVADRANVITELK
jgi:tetratricopeptide (TPR) repeat protein